MQPVRVRSLTSDLAAAMRSLTKGAPAVDRSREIVDRALQDGGVYYGVNTGFGVLAGKRVEAADLSTLQKNLLLSHAVGVGDPIPKSIARIMLQLKVHALSLGNSGVSRGTFDRLLLYAHEDLVPVIPSRGSVGASGDLAPLAHMSLPLLGIGSFWNVEGTAPVPASAILEQRGLKPITLQPKDGLSLINGTQMMCAYGASVLSRAVGFLRLVDIVAAMSLEALQGSIRPFDERIHAARPHPGQLAVAANVRSLLRESEILESHRDCGKVQDPYSLRCVPQVHGASRDALGFAEGVVDIEMNAVTDNPLVFDDGSVISGGNFHGQPLALALDFAAIALAELAAIAERRVYLLLAGHDGLPSLLMRETGLNSGFMIPQYTAAALVSENKVLCHPASVDSIPTSQGQEDHVSMGSVSALKLDQVFTNVQSVLAIELITAAQALDYRKPLEPGRGVAMAHEIVRSVIPHRESDYFFQEDLIPALALVQSGSLEKRLEAGGVEVH